MALKCTVLLLICVFFSKALALRCYGCIPDTSTGTCTQTHITCQSQCSSMTTAVYTVTGEVSKRQSQKTCADPNSCLTGSINNGISRETLNSECCNTDLCNSQTLQVLSRQPPNGKICYTCDDKGCSKMLPCEGDENQCFTVIVDIEGRKQTQKGCSSQLFCGSSPSRSNVSRLLGNNDMKCCEGNLCNSGAQGLRAFFFSLISLIFLLFV